MEPLYTARTEMTFEEYRKFNRYVNFYINRLPLVVLACAALLCLMAYLQRDWIFVVMAVLFPIAGFLARSRQEKKAYRSNESVQGTWCTYRFYEQGFEMESAIGHSRFAYRKLYRIAETKTNLYLMIAKNQGVILVKQDCPQGLVEFLRAKEEERKKGAGA